MTKFLLEDFKYEKKKGEITEYSLLVLDTNEKHKSGIDLKKLTEEEQKTVIEIQKKYEQDLNPFVKKAYRTFIIEQIINESVGG